MRSKAAPPAIANGNVPHLEAESLTEELRAFKVERFDADSYVQSRCQTMSEKVSVFYIPSFLLSALFFYTQQRNAFDYDELVLYILAWIDLLIDLCTLHQQSIDTLSL